MAVEPSPTVAFGITLTLARTEDGGRHTPLLGGTAPENRLTYRPNWGLPGMMPPEQTAAPVLGFSRTGIAPGEACEAVIVALFPEHAPWDRVEIGTELPMYDGSRMHGIGKVLWIEATTWRLPPDTEQRYVHWLETQ